MNFRDFLNSKTDARQPIFFDGGFGTMLQAIEASNAQDAQKGVPPLQQLLKPVSFPPKFRYQTPEELNLTLPDVVLSIHAAYVAAGANIITANTFGATSIKMSELSIPPHDVITAGVALVKKAINGKKDTFVAFDISTTGKLLEPMGSLTFDQAYESYKEACITAEQAGSDLILIETMSDLYETKAAILAAKENTSLPIFATVSFQKNLRTLTGADALTAVTYLEALGIDALGFNCGGSLEDAAVLTKQITDAATIPVIVQPNAGIPVVENGRTVFRVQSDEFAQAQVRSYEQGALILGGCCGTTPAHIQAMIQAVSATANSAAAHTEKHLAQCGKRTRICSYNQTIEIGSPENGPVIIGERINPTGKKKFKQALLDGNMQYILDEASAQIQAGAHILDVNVGLPGIDEQSMMLSAVKLLQESFRTPLQLDSSEPAVLENALRYYNGKALVNSVNGKQAVMDAVFPLIKKYGGTVVALALDENGIPPTAEERVHIAERIFQTADKYGIPRHDIVIDALTLTISSQQKEALETLKTIRIIKEKYGNKTVLGVSNISFGLPRREIINAHFFTQALAAGLDACIINPLSADMMQSFYAFRAIAGFDANCLDYIEHFAGTTAPSAQTAQTAVASTGTENATAAEKVQPQNDSGCLTLRSCIIKGFKDRSAELTRGLLQTESTLDIINNHIVPALDEVGHDFESGKKFLPQLLLSAETVACAFEVIKAHLAANGQAQQSKGKLLIATVYGDVHDIGKNIVKAMLENYGYTVIDMGKNVPVEDIVARIAQERITLVGLSALMTTTVASMEETIKAIRRYEQEAGYKVTVMVGGAVLTEDYAAKIGADYYTKDAMASIGVAKKVFN